MHFELELDIDFLKQQLRNMGVTCCTETCSYSLWPSG